MASSKQAFDASESTLATIYQLYVAVDKCFGLKAGQKVLIERFGDVTVSGETQTEVKDYTAPLSDSHPNLWNTLRNWLRPEFEHQHYTALVLLTTQEFGATSRFKQWNSSSLAVRLSLLEEIKNESELRDAELLKKKPDRKGVSESLMLQREVLSHADKQRLHTVIDKACICVTSAPGPIYFRQMCEAHAKTILKRKVEEYMQAVLGYVISPSVANSNAWEVSYEAFTGKLQELAKTFQVGTCIFPTKHRNSGVKDSKETTAFANHPFVLKIEEIQHHEAIQAAVKHYVYATRTIQEELAAYEVPSNAYDEFALSVLEVFEPKFRAAERNAKDALTDSKNFYDACIGDSNVPSFPGLETPDPGFRNGVLHMHFNDPQKKLRWKLL